MRTRDAQERGSRVHGEGSSSNERNVALPAGFPRPFGPYLLLSSYGRGGMGEVFLAQRQIDTREELCVLKTLRSDLCRDKSYVRRFLDEARVVVRLTHPNICAVHDVGQAGDEYFMVMEHLAGTNLRELLATLAEKQQRIDPGVALFIGSEMLGALAYAHDTVDPATGKALHIVHRDVSPHNVMVTYDGDVKLIDFGLAESDLKQEQTESHVVIGKVAYMSPEQARGDDVDATCDQFAAAVAIYETLVQDRYYGDMPTPQIWAIAGLGTHKARRLDDIHPSVRAVLTKALSPEPRDRFASCGEMKQALDDVRHQLIRGVGRAQCQRLMHEQFPERVESVERIKAAFTSENAAPRAPVEQRAISFHASRVLSAPGASGTELVPRKTSGSGAGAPVDATEITDRRRAAAAAQSSGARTGPVARTAPVVDIASNAPARSRLPLLLAAAAGVVALTALTAIAVVVATRDPARDERTSGGVDEPNVPAPRVMEPEAKPVDVEAKPVDVDVKPVDPPAIAVDVAPVEEKREPTTTTPATTTTTPTATDKTLIGRGEKKHLYSKKPAEDAGDVVGRGLQYATTPGAAPLTSPPALDTEKPSPPPEMTLAQIQSSLMKCAALPSPPACLSTSQINVIREMRDEAELTSFKRPAAKVCVNACRAAGAP